MRAKLLALVVLAAVAMHGPALAEIVAGSGLSTDADPAAAGKAAAEQAKKALGEKPAKVVLVFECYPRPDKAKILGGIASVFDKALVYGCSGEAPITTHGNPKGKSCGILALGGDIEVAAAVTPKIGGKYPEAGEALAKALPKMDSAKLMILFGNCHIPANKALVEGAQAVLGKELMIIGGAASGPSSDSFFKGEIQPDAAVGILLGGKFKVAAASAGGTGNDVVIKSATETATTATAQLGTKPAVAFLFECRGRQGTVKNIADELVALQGVLGKTLPLIGFYGSGEMGPEKGVCTGFGYHVVACVIGE